MSTAGLAEPKKEAPARAAAKVDPKVAARAAYVIAALLAIVFLISGSGLWGVANGTTYPLRQAVEWNWRARATNNLIDMAANLNQSIQILLPFHGNPAWIFPTPDTDLDQIRLSVVQTRDTALAVASSATIGSFGYQQAVQNLQETIIEINDHLSLAKSWYVRTPAAVVLVIGYLALTVLGLLVIAGGRLADKKMLRRPGILFGLLWFFGSVGMAVLLAITP